MSRLFFALWPGPAVREALARQAAAAADGSPGARPVHADNLHLTLAFLGAVPAPRFDDVLAAAQRVSACRFDFALRRLEHWAGADIVCAAPEEVPPPLGMLAAQLRDALRGLELPADDRPYRPHVTLCRKARQVAANHLAALATGIDWRAQEFVLAESANDGGRSVYRIRMRRSLAAPA